MLECYLSNRKVSGSILESTGSHASFPGQTFNSEMFPEAGLGMYEEKLGV